MPHQIDPRHMNRLLGPERRKMMDPDLILGHLHLKPGMVVADVGAGPGFFSLEAARAVGPNGKVFAIDVSREMLDACADRAREAGLANVETVLAKAPHDYPLPDAVADGVLMAVVLHEAESQTKMVAEVRRILKTGGTVVVVEWKKEAQAAGSTAAAAAAERPMGPPLASRVDPQQVAGEFAAAGFVRVDRFEVGAHHYGLSFVAPGP